MGMGMMVRILTMLQLLLNVPLVTAQCETTAAGCSAYSLITAGTCERRGARARSGRAGRGVFFSTP